MARHVVALIRGYKPDGTPEGLLPLNKALVGYANTVDPWARSVAVQMLTDVGRRTDAAWRKHSDEMGRALREQLKSTPMGAVYRDLLEEQVVLIKSLPLAAAKRAHALVQEGMLKSTRSSDIAKEILESSNIPVWRAKMIARTEVSRAAVTLTQVRAQALGSEGYIWRTVGDGDVRPDHKKMNGKYVSWNNPPSFPSEPTLGPYHAGCGPNCFTGSMMHSLANGVRTLWRAAYDGEMIDLVIGADTLAVTPNHPILTSNGWCVAGLLKQGDQVVSVLQQSAYIIGDDENQMMSFDDLFFALGVDADRSPDGCVLDFHGDIVDQQIDQVPVDWMLTGDVKLSIRQQFSEFLFAGSDGGVADGQVTHVLEADIARRRNLLATLFDGLALHCQDVRFPGSPDFDAKADQQLVDRRRRCSVFMGKCARAESGEVSRLYFIFRKIATVVCGFAPARNDETASTQQHADRVRVIADGGSCFFEQHAGSNERLCMVEQTRRYRFSGHVFTIETDTGWFGVATSNIVSKNCRCYPEPVLPEY